MVENPIHIDEIEVAASYISTRSNRTRAATELFRGVLDGFIGFIDADHFRCRKHAG